ncbi:MAG: 7-cyano-7-deazaguanine synthase QueC [Nitrospiraceae bacterium]|nr:7-cyano-7-deazaguanine synthase QueC [Nitrospiraceae bacterium]
MKKAVVLLSGGLDSATSAAIAKSEGYELYALSFDYAQRHVIELESAKKLAAYLEVKEHLVIKFDMGRIGGSALTSDIDVPKDKLPDGSSIPVTYVPARNTIFLSFALGWAEALGAEDIFIGANAVDYSGYPDCRPEYLKAFESMANLATKAAVEGRSRFRIRAPLLKMSKSDIIKTGINLKLNYALTWSCYDPQPTVSGYAVCRRCDSCLLRTRGFTEAGLTDPA